MPPILRINAIFDRTIMKHRNSISGSSKFFTMPKVIRRFRKNDDGATAIEFAMVAGPFFLLLFAIIETCLYFFAGQYFESGIDEVTRKIRTGQLQNMTSEDDFRNEICNELVAMFDCQNKNKMLIRVVTADEFDDIPEPPEPDDDGNYDDGEFTYETPGPLEIVEVRAVYLWPVYTNYSAPLAEDSMGGSKAIMTATAVVRTEPFN